MPLFTGGDQLRATDDVPMVPLKFPGALGLTVIVGVGATGVGVGATGVGVGATGVGATVG